MAYMNQEKKKKIAVALKQALGASARERGFKYSLSVRNHSTIELNISKGVQDFIGNYIGKAEENGRNIEAPKYLSVIPTSIDKSFSGDCCSILEKAAKCLNDGNHNKSDIMTDYFDVGWYAYINIGCWDKPYEIVDSL